MSEHIMVPRAVAERLDSEVGAGAGVFFNRQLEQVSTEILRAKRPTLNGLRLFPVNSGVHPGAQTYTRRMYEQLGVAELISSYGADLARADVAGIEESVQIRDVGLAYGYNVNEIAAAQMASRNGQGGISLPIERALAVRVGVETKLNAITWRGLPAAGLYGVLTHPYVARYAMPNLSTDAIDTVVADICAAFNSVKNDSLEVEQPNRILMASKLRNYLGTRFRTNTDTTILEMVVKGCEGLPNEAAIIGVHELNAAGVGGGDLMIVDRKDRLVMAHVLPIPFEQRPAQMRNFEYQIPCRGRTGGMEANFPGGMRIAEFGNAIS